MDVDLARETFQANVKVCANGSGFERGLDAAYDALRPPLRDNENAGFLRDDAALSILFVSDEDDLSDLPVNDYLTFFKGLKGSAGYRDDTLVNMSAVAGDPPNGCVPPELLHIDCADGLDDDGDGLIDCEDPDCQSSWACDAAERESDCADGDDNDGDGAVDCADTDCGYLNECRETACDNGIDDDGDGQMDCNDLDCLIDQREVCGELSCEDGDLAHQSGFFNFLLDCADPSCFTDPEWEEQCATERTEIDYTERCDLTVVFNQESGLVEGVDGPDVDDATSLENELAGCDDPDCATYWLCDQPVSAEGWDNCGDCLDNDGDGLEDCDDRDCDGSFYCNNPYEIDAGVRYIDVAVRSGGIVTSICAEEFSGLVRELGLNISGLRTIFYLSAWPVLGTIEVSLDGQVVTEGWSHDGIQNRILFTEEHVPPEGFTVTVVYTRSNTPPADQTEEQ
jgi:hypothetical protein